MKDIVEGLNRLYERLGRKGHFVLRRLSELPAIKAIKVYKALLWFINNSLQECVFSVSCTGKSTEDKLIISELTISFTMCLLEFITSEKWKNYGVQ